MSISQKCGTQSKPVTLWWASQLPDLRRVYHNLAHYSLFWIVLYGVRWWGFPRCKICSVVSRPYYRISVSTGDYYEYLYRLWDGRRRSTMRSQLAASHFVMTDRKIYLLIHESIADLITHCLHFNHLFSKSKVGSDGQNRMSHREKEHLLPVHFLHQFRYSLQ